MPMIRLTRLTRPQSYKLKSERPLTLKYFRVTAMFLAADITLTTLPS